MPGKTSLGGSCKTAHFLSTRLTSLSSVLWILLFEEKTVHSSASSASALSTDSSLIAFFLALLTSFRTMFSSLSARLSISSWHLAVCLSSALVTRVSSSTGGPPKIA
jgi:hypothetical protein